MVQAQIYEGTAEEIAAQLRVGKLTGRLKAVIMPDEMPNSDVSDLNDTLMDFLAEVDKTDFEPGQPLNNSQENEVGRLIAAKFAQQGHTK